MNEKKIKQMQYKVAREEQMTDRLIDIFILLIIGFIVYLKITGVITLSWFWLTCPLWGIFLLGCVLAIFLTIACLLQTYVFNKKKENKDGN